MLIYYTLILVLYHVRVAVIILTLTIPSLAPLSQAWERGRGHRSLYRNCLYGHDISGFSI